MCEDVFNVSLFTVGGPIRPGTLPVFDTAPLLMFTILGYN